MNRIELRQIFELMDTDRDGQISYEELKTGQNFAQDVIIKFSTTQKSNDLARSLIFFKHVVSSTWVLPTMASNTSWRRLIKTATVKAWVLSVKSATIIS